MYERMTEDGYQIAISGNDETGWRYRIVTPDMYILGELGTCSTRRKATAAGFERIWAHRKEEQATQ